MKEGKEEGKGTRSGEGDNRREGKGEERREVVCKGGDRKHNIKQISSVLLAIYPWDMAHTNILFRLVHPSSWWDGVPFPLLHVHLITLAKNCSDAQI